MNKQRAMEIASSPEMVNVTHFGVKVYIQHVDEHQNTARIYQLCNPEQEEVVSLNNLVEE